MSRHNQSSDFLIAAVVGAVLGATAAILLAPKPGKKLMEDVSSEGLQALIPEEMEQFSERTTEFLGNPVIWGGVAGTLLGAVTGLLLAPKPGSDIRESICDTYQQIADMTQNLLDNFNQKSQEIAQMANHQTAEWATRALDLADGLVQEAKEWAMTVEAAAAKARAQAAKMKQDPQYQHKIAEIVAWAQKAERTAENVSNEMHAWAQSIKKSAKRVDADLSRNGNHNALEDVMDWASVGLDLWHKIKSKKR